MGWTLFHFPFDFILFLSFICSFLFSFFILNLDRRSGVMSQSMIET